MEWIVYEPHVQYGNDYPLQDETRMILGKCFEVYNELGRGFLEVVYKDALAIEFAQSSVPYEREKKYGISYKGTLLQRNYIADFVVYNDVILEVKAAAGVIDEHLKMTLNYLAVSKCKVALLVNFGETSLRYKRLILSK